MLPIIQELLVAAPFFGLEFFARAWFPSLELGPVAFLFLPATAFPAFVHVVSGAGLATGWLEQMKALSGNGPWGWDSDVEWDPCSK